MASTTKLEQTMAELDKKVQPQRSTMRDYLLKYACAAMSSMSVVLPQKLQV
jgi:hypothetical protein